MIYTRLYLPLEKDEFEAIQQLAKKDMRGFRDQARFLLRSQLVLQGAITIHNSTAEIKEEILA